jgi:uncharacterized protein
MYVLSKIWREVFLLLLKGLKMAKNIRICLLLTVFLSSVSMGASSNVDPTDALFQAIEAGDADKVSALFNVSSRPDIHKANKLGMTPLLVAAEKGNVDIVQVLLERGANVNDAGPDKNTALHFAAQNGHINAAKLLNSSGANSQQYNSKGQTPTDLATEKGHQAIVDVLRPARDGYYGDMSPGGPGGPSSTSDSNAERAALDTLNETLKDPDEILSRVKTVPELAKKLEALAVACDKEELKWVSKKTRIKSRFAPAMLSQIDKELVLVTDAATKEKAQKTTDDTKAMQSRWKKRIREFSKQMREQLRTGGLGSTAGNVPTGRRGTSRRSSARSARTSSRATRGARGQANASDGYDDQMYPGSARTPDGPSPEEQAEERLVNNWVQADEGNMDTLYKTVHDQALVEYAAIREEATAEEAKNTIATIDGLLLARLNRFNQSTATIVANKAKWDAQQQPGMGPDEQIRGARGRGRRVR